MAPQKKLFHNFRYYQWLIFAYTRKHVLFIIIGISLGIIFGLKSRDIYNFLSPPLPTERIGIIGNFTSTNLPLEIQNLISSGLTGFDNNLKVVPQVALKYEIQNGGKTYIFNLKKNIKWQDGSMFSARDINYTFKDVKVFIENDFRIRFELQNPFAPFPSLVTQPLFKQGLVGVGQYSVQSIDKEGKFISKMVLRKRDKKIIVKFYPTQTDGFIGYKLGEINTIWGINDATVLSNWPHTKIIPYQSENRYVALFLNTRNGILADKTFRQALNYALEDNFIREKRAYVPISPLSWAYNDNVKKYEYNFSYAEKLLEKVISDSSASAKIKLKITALKPSEKYANIIADSWKKLGIIATVELAAVPPERFEVILAAQEIPYDPDQYLLWHSTSKLNITGYDNKRIDKLLEDGRKITDEKQRQEIYLEFQKYLVEDSPAIFLYYPTLYTITRT